MTRFKKTRWMNLIGGWGWAFVGIALFLNKLGNQPIGVLALIIVMYATLVATPLVTAAALKDTPSEKIRITAVGLNGFFVGLYALAVIGVVLQSFSAPGVMTRQLIALIPSALVFVIPELINIRALRNPTQ